MIIHLPGNPLDARRRSCAHAPPHAGMRRTPMRGIRLTLPWSRLPTFSWHGSIELSRRGALIFPRCEKNPFYCVAIQYITSNTYCVILIVSLRQINHITTHVVWTSSKLFYALLHFIFTHTWSETDTATTKCTRTGA